MNGTLERTTEARMLVEGPYPEGAVYLTVREVHQLLLVEPATLRQWVRRGQVKRVHRNQYDMGTVMNWMLRQGYRIPANALRLTP